MTDTQRQLLGYRLTTAEILYRMPDNLTVLQTFIWQTLDIAPEFPVIRHFLDFWQSEIEGPLHSVRIASAALVKPAEFRMVGHELILH